MATLHRDDSRETDRLTDTRKKVDDVSVVIIGALLLVGGGGRQEGGGLEVYEVYEGCQYITERLGFLLP